VRWDAVDAKVTKTKWPIAYGEVVWFRHPDAGVKLAGDIPPMMVARKPVARESAL
jgi:hypothetical protein